MSTIYCSGTRRDVALLVGSTSLRALSIARDQGDKSLTMCSKTARFEDTGEMRLRMSIEREGDPETSGCVSVTISFPAVYRLKTFCSTSVLSATSASCAPDNTSSWSCLCFRTHKPLHSVSLSSRIKWALINQWPNASILGRAAIYAETSKTIARTALTLRRSVVR